MFPAFASDSAGGLAAGGMAADVVAAAERGARRASARYASAPPDLLLREVVRCLEILDGLTGLTEPTRGRARVVGAWLCVLAGCLAVDCGRPEGARPYAAAAVRLGHLAGEPDLCAWGWEVDAWRALVTGRPFEAIARAETGRRYPVLGSPAAAQLAGQHAAAAALAGERAVAYAALRDAERAEGAVRSGSLLEHHFGYDRAKLASQTATALTWLADHRPAEQYARLVVHRTGGRRAATALLDLGMVLARTGRPEEACDAGIRAVTSGSLGQPAYWRAFALIRTVYSGYSDLPDAARLHRSVSEHQGHPIARCRAE